MRTFAEFWIIGRIGNVTPAGPILKVSIAADCGRRIPCARRATTVTGSPATVSPSPPASSTVWWRRSGAELQGAVHAR